MLFNTRKPDAGTAAGPVEVACAARDKAHSSRKRRRRERRHPKQRLRSALLRAVARGDVLLLGVLLGRTLDHRIEDREVRLVVAGDDLPLLAVPLLDAGDIGALMILAAELQRLDHAVEAQLLDPLGSEIEVLEAPTHLFA